MLYKRGGIWWFEFEFNGSRVRESAKTSSKTVAREAERARHRRLELGANGLRKRELRPLFPAAADRWLESKTGLTPLGRAYYKQYVGKLKKYFGNCLISDIVADDIAVLQRKRKSEGLSGRQINCEIATLRAILRHFGLWANISHRVKMLPERKDTGRALSQEQESRLLDEIGRSPSPALYPFFVLSLDAGLRPAEIRSLRHRDLHLTWDQGVVTEGEVVVSQSKTAAGSGRAVPLTRRACAALSMWLPRFPEAKPDSYVFPHHHVGISTEKDSKNKRIPWVWGTDLSKPMGQHSYKRAFDTARDRAAVECRFYDARHTFVTRLAENPAVSVETIRQLAGHVSERMLSRYAHIRVQARRDAIATLEGASKRSESGEFEAGSPQNPPQLDSGKDERRFTDAEKVLN